MFQPKFAALPPSQRALWPWLAEVPAHFVLYGGTAVALRLGHRESVDFDFFSSQTFIPDRLLDGIPWLRSPAPRLFQRQDQTLAAEVAGPAGPVRVSFFGGLGFGQVFPPDRCADNGLKIASAADLLALKLGLIQQRVEAKDYLDVCALLRSGLTLPVALGHLEALQPLTTNAMITLKTLVYFAGGDLDSLPADVKRSLEEAVRGVRDVVPFLGTKTLLGSRPAS